MTKNDFVKAVAEKVDFSQKNVKLLLSAIQDVVYENAINDEVPLIDGIKVTSAIRAARTGRNPSTGETISIPEKRVPKVKVGVALKKAIA